MAWLDKPFFGHGIGAFEQAYNPHRADHLWFLDTSVLSSPWVSAGAAHNLPLQILMELGLVGLVFIGVFLWRVGLTPGIFVALAICMIEFPEQNPASAVLLACLFAVSSPHGSAMRG